MNYVRKFSKIFYLTCCFFIVFTCVWVIQSSWRMNVFQIGNVPAIFSQQNNIIGYWPEPYLEHGEHDVFYNHAEREEIWDDQPLTIYEAIAQHEARTLKSCDNRCDDSGCNISRLSDWNVLVSRSKILFKPFLARGQYVFPWEKTHLSRPPLEDSRALPDFNRSKVTVEGVTRGLVRCNISDTVQGRVDLVDRYGNLRTTGDDEVRVWIKSVDKVGFAASGNVTDLKNGSYLFSFRCLWPGNSSITAW